MSAEPEFLEIVRTRRLEIVNDAGELRVVIGDGPVGVGLIIYVRPGKARLIASATDETDTAQLWFSDADSVTQINEGVENGTRYIDIFGAGNKALRIALALSLPLAPLPPWRRWLWPLQRSS